MKEDLFDGLALMRVLVLDLALEGFQGFLQVGGVVQVGTKEHPVLKLVVQASRGGGLDSLGGLMRGLGAIQETREGTGFLLVLSWSEIRIVG